MFLPVAERGMPTTISPSINFNLLALTPILYITRLSTFKRLAVLTADPTAIPKSMSLHAHMGPANSVPSLKSLRLVQRL